MKTPTTFPSVALIGAFLFSSFLLLKVSRAYAEKKAEEAAPAVAADLPSEFSCGVDIFYSWRRTPPVVTPVRGAPPAPTPDQEEFGVRKEFFTRVVLSGEKKAELELSLKSRIPAELGSAKAACNELHDDTGSCIASRVSSLGSRYQEFDFETRRTLRKRIADDCERQEGLCTSVEAGTIECLESKVNLPASAAAPAAAPEEKKKK